MDGTGGQMKTFCKAHDAEPGGILCTAPKVSSPRRSPAGHQQRRQGALYAAAGQSQHFLAERLRRAERHDSAVLHLGAGTDKAPPQPLERHANLPGIGVQRFDRSAQAGPGQARPHHAELPGGRKTHSVEILEYVFESLARSLLPVIQKYYESEDGKKVFAEWKAKKENTDCAST